MLNDALDIFSLDDPKAALNASIPKCMANSEHHGKAKYQDYQGDDLQNPEAGTKDADFPGRFTPSIIKSGFKNFGMGVCTLRKNATYCDSEIRMVSSWTKKQEASRHDSLLSPNKLPYGYCQTIEPPPKKVGRAWIITQRR